MNTTFTHQEEVVWNTQHFLHIAIFSVPRRGRYCRNGMQRLEAEGISTQMLSRDVFWDEKRCTQCGVCVSLCPSGALSAESASQRVRFDTNKCVACEYCILICPVQAMQIHLS